MAKYTPEELNNFSKKQLISLYENLQDQMEKLNRNMEAVLEQIRLTNQQRFGRKTEKLDQITGQMHLFNEIEEAADLRVGEPSTAGTVGDGCLRIRILRFAVSLLFIRQRILSST